MIVFVAPDPVSFSSGGNLYNALLMQSWRAWGFAFRQMEWSAYVKQGVHFSRDATVIFDSLYLEEMIVQAGFWEWPGRKCFLLHYLSSFHPFDKDLFGAQLNFLRRFENVICTGHVSFRRLAKAKACVPLSLLLPQNEILRRKALQFRERGLCEENSGRKKKILWVASLQPVKGVLGMLQALEPEAAFLSDRGVQITLAGAANGPEEYVEACRHLLEREPLRHLLTYRGELSHEALLALYPGHGYLLSTSHFETFGMAVQEALWYGLHVLALEADYLDFHRKEGRISAFAAFSDLAKAIKKILY